jgi:hypothetical protein
VPQAEAGVASERNRLLGKTGFLIAFRSPSDLNADLAGKAKSKSLPNHTLALPNGGSFAGSGLKYCLTRLKSAL